MTARLVRWGIPLVLVVVGAALIPVQEGVGEAIIGAAACVVVGNMLLRLGFDSDGDRDREEEARAYFDEHGHWPDEAP